MTCVRECIQRCKNDRNIVTTGAGLSDFDDSNYTIATYESGVGGSRVSREGEVGQAGKSTSVSF